MKNYGFKVRVAKCWLANNWGKTVHIYIFVDELFVSLWFRLFNSFYLGFLYVSDFLHRWLTATQYIAPLMANFDTTIADATSNIRYTHNGIYDIIDG